MITVERLADKDAIRELKARYFGCLDPKDWDAWRALFTDDLVVHVDLTPSHAGERGDPAPKPDGGVGAFVAVHRERLADYVIDLVDDFPAVPDDLADDVAVEGIALAR